jgi:hypothetical protein
VNKGIGKVKEKTMAQSALNVKFQHIDTNFSGVTKGPFFYLLGKAQLGVRADYIDWPLDGYLCGLRGSGV